jgi:nicotinamidase/pyrazinamidase
MTQALIVVDVQHDFVSGSLAVAGGQAVADRAAELAPRFDLTLATRDWHPADHVSFADADNPPFVNGYWPSHCVVGTAGAELLPEVQAIADVIVNKGHEQAYETYGAFDRAVQVAYLSEKARALLGDEQAERLLAGELIELDALLSLLDVTDTTIIGIAGDFCVPATAVGSTAAGFPTIVDRSAVASVDPANGEKALNALGEHPLATLVG